ncbi:hypothetical protein FN846DRAFT_908234 [Sphaerosporella brunnea]|uniref:Uncharacterized protein n=1 Tax=Sphaerosporella brunnea TaxID=1250544 RepID=A0A5J5EU06_9PEZI|nr:hypothetical protein FN846DRAFT_908234 [Sphaerosporella brunnea]
MQEDAMQAALPKMVKGVRVADFGQGNESMRILGIRWLEAGDATEDTHGMPGEEGDFANFEIAVAYRSRPHENGPKGLKKRSRNAHLLIEFWSVGGLRLPVWVEVTGFLATARMRVQLTSNPPFLSLAIVTLLGQPKVNVSCVPITKNFLNIMDVPIMNKFLRSSIDQAISTYVAPRSLTLDLKTLLGGAEKTNTDAIGVLFIRVISAEGFKDGDGGKKWLSEEKKRGDPIIQNEGLLVWAESDPMLLGQTETDADENVRLQLWDSDRTTADDLLGLVQVSLKDLITNDVTKNCISAREDCFCDYDGESCPGKVLWGVGFFEKTKLNDYLKRRGYVDAESTTRKIEEEAERKLREAKGLDEFGQVEQQKAEDLKERTDEIISGSGSEPTGEYQAESWLEVDKIRESGVNKGAEDEEGDDLPSSYCSVNINHQKFVASTERFLRDWHTTTLIISVRDSREHEADPLLGVVVLPLHRVFSNRSQVTSSYPLVGGIGYGRLRLSLIFRSVYLQLPRPLAGWNTGTLEMFPHASASGLPNDLLQCRLLFRTLYAKRKMFASSSNPGEWNRKHLDLPILLAYSIGPDTTPAWAVLWLKDIVDDEMMELELPVCRGHMKRAVNNCVSEGEVIGSLRLKLRFWPGLSGYHQSVAGADWDMRDVMEMLEAAEDAREVEEYCSDVSMSSSSDSDSGEEDDWKRRFKDELKEYKHKHKDLHRRHRGLMQFRAARKFAWIRHGIKERGYEIGHETKARWKHRSGYPDGGEMETEV